MSAQMVPFDRPVFTSSSVCSGSWTKKTSSAAPSRIQRMLSLTHWPARFRGGAPAGVSGIDAASMERDPSGLDRSRRPAGRRPVLGAPPLAVRMLRSWSGAGLRLQDLAEDELAALHDVRAVVRQRGVAVLVDRVAAEDGVAVLDLVERVDHRLAVVALVARVLDRQQRDLHRLVAVDRVRLG